MGNGFGPSCTCCCKESSVKSAASKGSKGKSDKTEPPKPVERVGQSRANLQVKGGGFSLGAFAASNRGTVEDYYNVESSVIGEGSYGSVQKCENKDTKQIRALKSISKKLVKNEEQFQEEMGIMKLLDHPNIVRLYETFEDQKFVYLVMEICEGGELFDRIVDAGNFTEQVAAKVVQQMLRAINYMHQNNIMHRDLKPENWLLASPGEIHKTDLKLIDFGLAKRFVPGEFASTKAGTPYYVAPEVLEGRYAEKSDIWSIGVIMYIMLCGNPPFSGNDTVAVLESVKRAKFQFDKKEWKNISQDAKSLLKSLLTKDAATRPSASAALQAEWIEKMLKSAGNTGQMTTLAVSSLKAFAAMNKLKKMALNIIASQLTDGAIKEMKDMFLRMDVDSDGTLTVGELKEGLKRNGVAIPPDLDAMMDAIDTDGSGVIDYSEFLAATLDKRKYMQEDVVWRAFKTLDVDGSGTIDREEIIKLLGLQEVDAITGVRVNEKEVDAIMKEVDLNGDGRIDFEEFMAMMKKMPAKSKLR